MMTPEFYAEDNALYNTLIAAYNDGIQTLADMLIDRLTEEATETENK